MQGHGLGRILSVPWSLSLDVAQSKISSSSEIELDA